MNTRHWDVLIIGGGTAGLSAAQMLGRARRRTLVIDAGEPRNRFAAHMHGVLGHDGLDPAELLARGRREARAYGVEIMDGRVTGIHDEGRMLRVDRADGTQDLARAVLIATGVHDDLPPIPGLDAQWGRGVLHCPYCHGFEVAGRRLGVLAVMPHSLHQIELLRQWSDDVTAFTAAIEPLADEARARLVARGIRIVSTPVAEMLSADEALSAVRTADGADHAIDALFTAATPVIDLGFADALALTRVPDQPGAPVAVDAVMGATSHPRVWAAGNTVSPYGNVPVSMASGSMAGAAINAALVAEDAADAVDARRAARNAHWEERYAENDRFWSGNVNATLAAVAQTLTPGTVLDLGCGEGADVVWLAEQGWTATGIDVSASAIARASAAARDRGLDDSRVRFAAGDAAAALPEETFDLVTSSFLHSWEEDFPRLAILRAASERVAPGGRMLVISHATPPPWAREQPAHTLPMRTPAEEFDLLGLDPAEWHPERIETVAREVTGPDGAPASLDDGVLLLRRR
ncbi:SAM-dependent methyltransferase [uncultured Microbacterium sp.]|uniref:SAM-dependent methyltransferase n=1 Tax=uncultured Microbacterium sp. TaxID=191216 RepID=UPI002626E1A3|nr:SAM-dependent methyltransferase [uncultured Microbacterium sp.]